MATFRGTKYGDSFDGTTGDDIAFGLGGSDYLDGANGNDRLSGGTGDDGLDGGAGDDVLDGGAGYDLLFGRDGDDHLIGGGGYDELYGESGNDLLEGGAVDDRLTGGDGNDVLLGGAGYDFCLGGAGVDQLIGDTGGDTLRGELGDDVLDGGDGDDALRGGDGKDRLDGGAGIDQVSFFEFGTTEGVRVNLASGVVRNDGFGNRERITAFEAVAAGTPFADWVSGSDADNGLFVSARDTAFGLGGDDVISAGSVRGATLDGGAGHDRLSLTGAILSYDADRRLVWTYAEHGATVDLRTQAVTDGFGASATVAGFEDVWGAGYDDTLIGDFRDNVLSGFGGNDRLVGGNGDDLLDGGTISADVLSGGSGSDIFAYDVDSDWFMGEFDHGSLIVDEITDFAHGDQIRILDVFGTTFTFIGTNAFSGARGEVRFELVDGDTIVSAQYGGEIDADLQIRLSGEITLTAADFTFGA